MSEKLKILSLKKKKRRFFNWPTLTLPGSRTQINENLTPANSTLDQRDNRNDSTYETLNNAETIPKVPLSAEVNTSRVVSPPFQLDDVNMCKAESLSSGEFDNKKGESELCSPSDLTLISNQPENSNVSNIVNPPKTPLDINGISSIDGELKSEIVSKSNRVVTFASTPMTSKSIETIGYEEESFDDLTEETQHWTSSVSSFEDIETDLTKSKQNTTKGVALATPDSFKALKNSANIQLRTPASFTPSAASTSNQSPKTNQQGLPVFFNNIPKLLDRSKTGMKKCLSAPGIDTMLSDMAKVCHSSASENYLPGIAKITLEDFDKEFERCYKCEISYQLPGLNRPCLRSDRRKALEDFNQKKQNLLADNTYYC